MTDTEIMESLVEIDESFIKIERYYHPDGSKFYGVRICSRQDEKPFYGSTVREALSAMLEAVNPPNAAITSDCQDCLHYLSINDDRDGLCLFTGRARICKGICPDFTNMKEPN